MVSNVPVGRRAVAIGIDLAWSDRNLSGCVAVDASGQVVEEALLSGDEEIVNWICRLAADSCTVAIDAPLAVPNTLGQRPCERSVASSYGAKHAGPHSSNRTLLEALHGRLRGEDIVGLLREHYFDHPASESLRQYLEVYPHPAILEMFALDSIIKYKKAKGRIVSARRVELRRLNSLIATLCDAFPPLVVEPLDIPDDLGGGALKEIEDLLDARLCAWIAVCWQAYGESRIQIFGSPTDGHIAVPKGSAFAHYAIPPRSYLTPPD